ncbi:hypothetical protein [Pedobacter arcticus]|uniref:hypothetical protein n=1 Tax=Pedobacter arcticus TaxID=752140 RepID=UPI000377E89B|nr:hypothetical protein [Pedobacter arcticus]
MRTTIVLTTILQFLILSISNAQTGVAIYGLIKDKNTKTALPYVNVVLKTETDNSFVTGTVSTHS